MSWKNKTYPISIEQYLHCKHDVLSQTQYIPSNNGKIPGLIANNATGSNLGVSRVAQ